MCGVGGRASGSATVNFTAAGGMADGWMPLPPPSEQCVLEVDRAGPSGTRALMRRATSFHYEPPIAHTKIRHV